MENAIPILFQDDHIVVISKPGGMAVHRGMGVPRTEPFVLQTVSDQTGCYLYPVHRLDRPTSGVMAFALTKAAATALQESLGDPRARKEYLVLARGDTPDAFITDRPLRNKNGEPQPARTDFDCVARFERCSLLAARLSTGRFHQIRRHLAHLAHQVIGDSTHGKGRINQWFRDTYGLPRMFMHARRLVIPHPMHDELMTFEDPLAPDLRAFLQRIPSFDSALLEQL